MSDPITLVPKPTPEAEVRDSVIRILREMLEEAEAGHLTSVFVILQDENGLWAHRASKTTRISETIGRIEMAKQELIANYLKEAE